MLLRLRCMPRYSRCLLISLRRALFLLLLAGFAWSLSLCASAMFNTSAAFNTTSSRPHQPIHPPLLASRCPPAPQSTQIRLHKGSQAGLSNRPHHGSQAKLSASTDSRTPPDSTLRTISRIALGSRLSGWSIESPSLSPRHDTGSPKHSLANLRRRLRGCTDRDLSISQSRDMSGGAAMFIVQIYNTCVNNCAPSDVHVYCGWFASKVVVNPSVFKRLSFNDCLVNGGKPLPRGQILRFTYQNSFMYPLSFRSAKFC